MSRMAFSLVVTLVLGVVCTAQNKTPTVRESDLAQAPFAVGDLALKIVDLKGGLFGLAPIVVEVEASNASDAPIRFDPHRLSFVKADGKQVDVIGVFYTTEISREAHDILVLPKARAKQNYLLNDRLNLPARVYYEGTLLAEIVD
jgi:hypothetical protein